MQIEGGISYNTNTSPIIWEMHITVGTQTKTVSYPLTVNFNITRNTSAQANTATFAIYNLSPSSRASDFFFQDRFATDKKKYVEFYAGHVGEMCKCFSGYIQESYSKRENADVITTMQCIDMGVPGQYINQTFEAGQPLKDVLKNLCQNINGASLANIGTFEGTLQYPLTVEGNPLDTLNTLTNGNAFIDNGQINILQPNEAIDRGVQSLNADTGLLGTPMRSGGEIVANGIFNPNIIVGQLVEVNSSTASEFNGTYQLTGFTHQGTTSGSVQSTCTTTYNFMIGVLLPDGAYSIGNTKGFKKVNGEEVTQVQGNYSNDIYSVYQYIQTHNGTPPTSKIGNTIYTWKEALLPNGSGNTTTQIYNQITLEYLQNIKQIFVKLTTFVNKYLNGKKINVISNWRSRENNARLSNAASESKHLEGSAIDFDVQGVSMNKVWNVFNNNWDKFTYRYFVGGNQFKIHVQSTYGKGGARR